MSANKIPIANMGLFGDKICLAEIYGEKSSRNGSGSDLPGDFYSHLNPEERSRIETGRSTLELLVAKLLPKNSHPKEVGLFAVVDRAEGLQPGQCIRVRTNGDTVEAGVNVRVPTRRAGIQNNYEIAVRRTRWTHAEYLGRAYPYP